MARRLIDLSDRNKDFTMSEQKYLHLSRRSLIKSVGALSISIPFMEALAQAQAFGETGPLKRVVFLCGEAGGSSYWWRPQGGEYDFRINFDGATLRALEPLRRKILIINGVGNYAVAFGGTESHEVRSVTFTAWSNSKQGDPNFSRGVSVDRGIINRLGESRPLYATIGGNGGGTGSEYYYAKPGYPITGVGTSVGIFEALFANRPTLPNQGGSRLSPQQVLQKTLWEQQLNDAKMLRNRLGKDAQLKVDEYLATLRERLDALQTPQNLPSVPNRPNNPDYNQTISVDGPYDMYTRDLDLIADALSLGVTRVACLKLAHWVMEDSFLGENISLYRDDGRPAGSMRISDYHQHVAHAQWVGDQYRNLDPNLIVRDVQTAQTKVVARFLTRLDQAREKDGSSVLDNTLFVWTTQLADQSCHLSGRLPYVLAGGLGEKAGTFRMGRYLDFAPGGISSPEELKAANCPVAQHQLLNSIQRTFGIEQDVFGENLNNSRCRGYLPRALG